ncbi:PTS galactitol transporter subunit IIC [Anaeropeptidivorans aminofermentans]|uniref:PTS galactitol transporter subunit IIC n=1 Tax=Anaeropeptidivorans aminofermentans TaxID=2934315 RepID=UPI002024763C|nr:PTS transporter subunit IIC [Anaeropeptidivorans aminofermentans]
MEALLNSVNYIIGLGAAVFLPIIMFGLGLLFGLKPGRALRSGIMFGVAFTAVNIFISQLLVGQIAPIAKEAVTQSGLELTALDVGWSAASMISWAWPYAATMFPIQIAVNILMLAIGFTSTLNVDLWNVWSKIFAAAVTYFFTGNLILSYLVAILVVIIELKLGDYVAIRVQKTSGIPDITVPHLGMMFLLPIMPLAYLLDRIPALNKSPLDAAALRRKFGFIGDPMILGAIMGILLGLISGSGITATLKLSITVATVMLVLPRLASIFSEALQPISEAAAEFMKRRFPGKKVYIGLDWPVLAGNESVITSSIILIPVLVLLAFIIPGNKTLPFGDVANFASILMGAAVISKGDLRKTLIMGIPILAIALMGASAVATPFTQLAQSVGYEMPAGAAEITWLKTSPVVWGLFGFLEKNFIIGIVMVVLGLISFYILKKFYAEPDLKELEESQNK